MKRLNKKKEIIPEDIKYFLGHSLGEYNALCAVGVFDPIDTVKLLRYRGELVVKATKDKKTGMLLGICDEETISPFVEETKKVFPKLICDISAYNSPI